MHKPPPRQGLLFAICLLSGCISTHQLPKVLPISEDRYPPASRRLGEEGRVLIEFNLDGHRRTVAPRVTKSAGGARLDVAALRLIQDLPFDPSDHQKPSSGLTYRVTVIFCLKPGHCDDLVPFPGTEPMLVKATKPPEPHIIFD